MWKTAAILMLHLVVLTSHQNASEKCDTDLSTCLYYAGTCKNNLFSIEKYCKTTGGQVPEIKSQKMQTFVESFASNLLENGSIFINLRKNMPDANIYESVKGKFRKEIKFADKEYRNENFLALKDRNVESASSEAKFKSVCIYRDSFRCTRNVIKNKQCFEINSKEISWYEARNYCLNNGGDLMDFEDYTLLNRYNFSELLNNTSCHLGNSRIKWAWSNSKDEFISYTNWFGGFDTSEFNDNRTCVVVDFKRGFKWVAKDCTQYEVLATVCMKSGGKNLIVVYVSIVIFVVAVGVAMCVASWRFFCVSQFLYAICRKQRTPKKTKSVSDGKSKFKNLYKKHYSPDMDYCDIDLSGVYEGIQASRISKCYSLEVHFKTSVSECLR